MKSEADGKKDAPPRLDPRLHGVLANPLRHEIVMRTSARPWSPTELAEATGRSLKHVSKALEELKKENLVELVGRKPGPRGGSVHLYRACRFVLSAEQWERLSNLEQASATGGIIVGLSTDMADALEAGKFSHPHHAMIRDHRQVDDEGLKHCSNILVRAYKEILVAEEESLDRCKDSGEEPFGIAVGLAAFPRAPEDTSG
jgi:DNA-binding transcriptional ArsR family regulator